jgi:hypothetical protein
MHWFSYLMAYRFIGSIFLKGKIVTTILNLINEALINASLLLILILELFLMSHDGRGEKLLSSFLLRFSRSDCAFLFIRGAA